MTLSQEQTKKIILMIQKDLALLEDQRYSYEMTMKHQINEFAQSHKQIDPYSQRIIEDYKKLIDRHSWEIDMLYKIMEELKKQQNNNK